MTFQLVDCLNQTAQMNSSNTNTGGWNGSAMRTRMATYKSQLPEALRNVIKTVKKKSGTGGGSSNGTQTTNDDLFLLSEIEIFGTTTYSVAGEGTQYAWYKAGNTRIKKVNGSASTWWGSVRLVAATPTISAVWTVRETPTITTPTTLMACPSASAFNPIINTNPAP